MAKLKFNITMFDKIKETLKKTESSSNGSFTNIMKFPAGHTYTIRLIPDVEGLQNDNDKTFYHHYVNSWKSNATGGYISALALNTFGQKDPISDLRWKLYKEWKDANPNPGVDKEGKPTRFKGPIDQKEQWYVNIYVIDDPSNPENNGTVKVLKMGPQLKNIIDEAMTGDRSDEFGAAIFDLSKDGADFKIVAQQQGEYTTFIKSYFKSKSSIDLDDDEIDKIYSQTHKLDEIQPVKTYEELEHLLSDHFFCEVETKSEVKKSLVAQKAVVATKKSEPVEEKDEIPMEWDEAPDEEEVTTAVKPKSTKTPSKIEDDVDELLAGLDIL